VENFKDIAVALYHHLELAKSIGLIKTNIDKVKLALVPCWTQLQCFLREISIAVLAFFGFEFDALGEVTGLNPFKFVESTIIIIIGIVVLKKVLTKIVMSAKVNSWISKFGA